MGYRTLAVRDMVANASDYLPTIEKRLRNLQGRRFGLCLHNAGMDPHEDCPAGALAGILRKTPNIKWTKDRGKEPKRERDDYPWFWSGKVFMGDRVNDVHLANQDKMDARRYQS